MRQRLDTRGILRPGQIGRAFALERPPVDPRLQRLVASHWAVTWALPPGESRRSEVLTHPAVHLVVEPHGTFVYGVRRRLDVRTLSGSGYAVGARFRPGAFGALVERPVAELTDRVLPAADVFGETPGREAADTAGRVAALERFLLERLPQPTAEAQLVREIVEDIATAPPGLSVAALAARHGVSPRTLQRLFARHVGVSPKWVLRRLRLHDALEGLQRGARPDWTRFSLDLGYFDHAHFIRDFRAVVGRSPAQYAREVS